MDMGIPPAISLLLVSDTPSYRETVTEVLDDHPDLRLTATVVPDDANAEHTAPADCVLVDADTDGLSLSAFRAALRRHHPALPVLVAAADPATIPPRVSTHATLAKADTPMIPTVARVVTPTRRRQVSPSVSADQQ